MSDGTVFYMVWNPHGHAPTRRHELRQHAINEAERLARANPGVEFYILEAIEMRTIHEPMRRVTLEHPIPF